MPEHGSGALRKWQTKLRKKWKKNKIRKGKRKKKEKEGKRDKKKERKEKMKILCHEEDKIFLQVISTNFEDTEM